MLEHRARPPTEKPILVKGVGRGQNELSQNLAPNPKRPRDRLTFPGFCAILQAIVCAIGCARRNDEGVIAIATIRDVAERAGVSVTTVSHVINDTRFVSEELRGRVLRAIEELNYQPSGVARSLRRKRTHTIGMIIPDNTNPFFAEVARGIEDASFELGYNVILCNSDGDLEKEMDYLGLLIEKRVDGLVFVSAGSNQATIEMLSTQEVPVVIVDRDISELAMDSVLTDNRRGGYQATHYLLTLGHRRIACITGPSQLTPSAERVTGYRNALEEAGVAVDDLLILAGDFQSQSGHEAMRSLLTLSSPPTAVFVCNDLMAIGALCAAHEAGLRVPQQLSIVGFDDIALASFTTPRLTTVAQPKYEMGLLAAEMLAERIKHKDLSPRRRFLDVELIIRDSCAALQS